MFGKKKPPAAEIVGYAIETLEHLPEGFLSYQVSRNPMDRRQLTLEIAPSVKFDSDFPLRYHYSEKSLLWTKDCPLLDNPQLAEVSDFGKTWHVAMTAHMLPIVLDDVGLFHAVSLELLEEEHEKRVHYSDSAALAFFDEIAIRFNLWAGALNGLLDFRKMNEHEVWHEMIELFLPLHVTTFDSLATWLEEYLPDSLEERLDSLRGRISAES